MTDSAKPPISLTPKAADMVREIRADQNIPDDQALRMGVRGGGCSGYMYDLSFDAPRPEGDHVFVLEGVTVVVDEKSLQLLQGTELDFLDGLNGTGFKFNNPNVKGTCGCGTSFC